MLVGANGASVPMLTWHSGRYYFCPPAPTVTTSNTLGDGTLRVTPFWVPNTIVVTRIGAEITGAQAGTLLRLGIYADSGLGRPHALIIDAGTIDGNSATVQEITGLTVTLAPGWYWAAGCVQNAGTQPTVRVISSSQAPIDLGTSAPTAAVVTFGFQKTGVTGALPSPFGSVSGGSANFPRIFVKVGA